MQWLEISDLASESMHLARLVCVGWATVECRVFKFMRFGLLALWAAGLYGALLLGSVAGNWGHVCGPWGCGPTLQSLVAMHGFWLLLLALPVAMVIAFTVPKVRQRLGTGLMLLALAGLVGVAVWEWMNWLPLIASPTPRLLVGRYFFRLACLVDVPIVQTFVAGFALLVSTRVVVRTFGPGPVQVEEASHT